MTQLGPSTGDVPLRIRVSAGAGSGSNQLSAFDAALRDAGVADHNLIRLSSVIPAGATVEVCADGEQLRGDFGDRLYCVYAVAFAAEPGESAWAGIGWALAGDGSGRGLFVEHAGQSEGEVNGLIEATLTEMSAGRGGAFALEDKVLSAAHCHGQPACSVVVATYRTQGWRQQ